MNNTKIILYQNNNEEIDLFDNFPIILNKSIADIRQPDKRQKSYSLDIEIPGSQKNNLIFKQIFDISVTNSYNTNIKLPCIIEKDSIRIFEGYLQLNSIQTKNIFESDIISYSITVYGDNANFFDALIITENNQTRDKKLRDLNLSALTHTYDETTIENSWVNTWEDGYVYPLIDYGINSAITKWLAGFPSLVRIENFRPAVYIKYLWDKIFEEEGWTYQSEFLESDYFKELILPYYKKDFLLENTPADFYIGSTNNSVYSATTIFNNEQYVNNTQFIINGLIDTGLSPFNSNNFFDNFGRIDSNGNYTAPYTGTYEFTVRYELSISAITLPQPISDFFVDLYIEEVGTTNRQIGDTQEGEIEFVNNTTPLILKRTRQLSVFCESGKLYRIGINFGSRTQPTPTNRIIISGLIASGCTWSTSNEDDIPTLSTVGRDSIINFNNINKWGELTTKDFIIEIAKLFNLYFEYDENKTKNIIIEPRDEFYNKGQIKNYDNYLDIKNLNQLPTEYTNINLKYKDENDLLNKKYIEKNIINYGQYEYDDLNNIKKDNFIIESKFGATPFIINNGVNITKIVGENNEIIDFTERILFYNGIKTSPFQYSLFSPTNFKTTYPQTLHFNDDFDLNFNTVKPFANNNNGINTFELPINNLYYKFYKNQTDELLANDYKFLTTKFWIPANKFREINFKDLWQVKNILFRLNKIKYNIDTEFAEIELIKVIKKPIVYSGNTTTNILEGTWKLDSNGNINNGIGNIVNGNNNIVNGNGLLVNGSSNFFGAGIENGIVIGQNNTLLSNINNITINSNNSLFSTNNQSNFNYRGNFGSNFKINSIFIDGDFLYCAGAIYFYDNQPVNRIIKINKNTGIRDLSFDVSQINFDGEVLCIVDLGTDLMVGGSFSGGIKRINKTTGAEVVLTDTVDNFNGWDTLDWEPFRNVACFLLDGTDLFIGGELIISVGGVTRPEMIKYDTITNTVDNTWGNTTGFFGGGVQRIEKDGTDLIVMGSFISYDGVDRNRICKLAISDGTLDLTFDTSVDGPDETVRTYVKDGSEFIIGGGFVVWLGSTTRTGGIAKIDGSTSTLVTTFDNFFEDITLVGDTKKRPYNMANQYTFNIPSTINKMLLIDDKVYCFGAFHRVKFLPTTCVFVVNKDTGVVDLSKDYSFGGYSLTSPHIGDGIKVSEVIEDGDFLYCAGTFTTFKGQTVNDLVKINKNTWTLA